MRIRRIDITHFRGIQSLTWCPGDGINCLIGPGDGGKSTVLDAVDLCLGARRSAQFTDADFFEGDVASPIEIVVTIGGLDDGLKSLETYGLHLRAFDAITGEIEDEPQAGLETVLCPRLSVGPDLEPVWDLASDRAAGSSRNLAWADRARLAPARIGVHADGNLAWRRNSVLSRLTEDEEGMTKALRKAGRDARTSFGDAADAELGPALRTVMEVAGELGVDIGSKARAMLDAQSVNFASGMVSLHDEAGIPLRTLGVGSARLLAAGLQRRAASRVAPLLADEVEHGLEPHRIIRLLGSLGAKEAPPPLQVIATTHSPVVVHELSAPQLTVLRNSDGDVTARRVPDDMQGTLRAYSEAFLARSILVCEGASEVGLARGLDQRVVLKGGPSLFARGSTLVDAGGVTQVVRTARVFQELGYRIAILRDDDVSPGPGEDDLIASGGSVFMWRLGHALEDELFHSLPPFALAKLLEFAVEWRGEQAVNDQIRNHSGNAFDLKTAQTCAASGDVSPELRRALGFASRKAKKERQNWFKTVSAMEEIAREVVGPAFRDADQEFRQVVKELIAWLRDG